MGRLDVRIVEARNLPNTELMGKSDPYVTMTLEGASHKTSVKEGANPKWDEVFKFVVADPDSAQLVLKLWNKNLVSDDYMGEYNLNLSGLTKGEVKDGWYLLQQCKSNAEIHVRMMAHDFGRAPKPAAPVVAGKMPPAAAGYAAAPPPAAYGGGPSHRDRLIAFYSRIDPSKVASVDVVLAKYAGNENAMWQQLTAKYGPEAPFVAAPPPQMQTRMQAQQQQQQAMMMQQQQQQAMMMQQQQQAMQQQQQQAMMMQQQQQQQAQNAIQQVMAMPIDSDSKQRLIKSFKLFDADGSNLLNRDEAFAAMLSFLPNASPMELQQIIARADTSGDGQLDAAEYARLSLPYIEKQKQQEQLRAQQMQMQHMQQMQMQQAGGMMGGAMGMAAGMIVMATGMMGMSGGRR